MKTLLLSAAAALVLSATVHAQAAPRAAQTTKAPAEGVQLATELLQLLQVDSVMNVTSQSMIDAQLQANPMMAPYRDVLEAWTRKYLGWDYMGVRIAQLYAETFTVQELRETLRFYRTPTGSKFARLTPLLTQQGAALGRQIAMEHNAELEALLRARAESLSVTPATRPPQ